MNKIFIRFICLLLTVGYASLYSENQAPTEQNLKIIGSSSTMDQEKLQAALKEALRPKTVCLNMIVKNEQDVIGRCLLSVKPFINYWVIVDTGSTDKTKELVKMYLVDIPGELHESPFQNFEHNRNEALQWAKGKGEYILFIDADEVWETVPNYKLPPLNRDFYHVITKYGGTQYNRIGLVKSSLDWKWTGVLHEYLWSSQAKVGGLLEGVANIPRTDGARSKDPKKYIKDALVLEEALKKEPNNERYAYYLAQSYMDGGENEKAIEAYERRIAMGGWNEEVYISLLNLAHCKWRCGQPAALVIEAYRKAHNFRPSRVESLYYMGNYMRTHDMEAEAYPVLKLALATPESKDQLFVQSWIYDYGLLFEFSIAAYWAGQYQESVDAIDKLLKNPHLPDSYKEFAKKNRVFAEKKLEQLYLKPSAA